MTANHATEIDALQAIVDDPNCTAAERRKVIELMALTPDDQPFTTELTPEGEQYVIPGAEKRTTATKPQGELFG